MQRITFDVPDLTADAEAPLEAALVDLIGVYISDADAASGRVTITYDEGWLGEAGLAGVIQDAGFTVPEAPTRPGS